MTHREKYEKYIQMYNSLEDKEQIIKNFCKKHNMTIYKNIVFISVANEEKDLYFVDYEYSSPITKYKRVYGNIPGSKFEEMKGETK